jgi:hypothetical protein
MAQAVDEERDHALAVSRSGPAGPMPGDAVFSVTTLLRLLNGRSFRMVLE